jgi:replication-associated recombination protein RarA
MDESAYFIFPLQFYRFDTPQVHRFNKGQQASWPLSTLGLSVELTQDIFLPFLERGYIQVSDPTYRSIFILIQEQLIGATTENPSFKLIGALLSRCR